MTKTTVIGGPRRRLRAGGALAGGAIVAILSGIAALPAAAQGTDLDGAWRADRYELANGNAHALAGHILFVDGEWNVLFFVLDAEGDPVRMSAEGGTFTRAGEELVFTHLYYSAKGDAVEGMDATPFDMRVRSEPLVEPSRATVEGDRMTLFFPSGNRMTFTRAPRP